MREAQKVEDAGSVCGGCKKRENQSNAGIIESVR